MPTKLGSARKKQPPPGARRRVAASSQEVIPFPAPASRPRPRPRPRLRAVKTPSRSLQIGVAYDLRSEVEALLTQRRGDSDPRPEDMFEEYDSEATVSAIEEALRSAGHEPRRLGSGRRLMTAMMDDPCQLVFNIAEGWGTRSREAHVPAVLETLGVPYTHSDPLTLALTLDKGLAKRVVASCSVRTPRFEVLTCVDDVNRLELEYPLIAKPLFEGSSMGIRKGSRVTDADGLRGLLAGLLVSYREPVLVEEFCDGPELTVGILGSGDKAKVIGSMQIEPRDGNLSTFVYSLEVKRNYLEEVTYHAPPRLDRAMVEDAEATALAAHRALGCQDISRVDLRFCSDNKACFLEVNPLPGLNPVSSDLAMMCRGYGIPYDELIMRIVEEARARLHV